MNKTQRKQALRELIDRQPFETLFNPEDTRTMNALTGWNFELYKRQVNPAWPKDTRCVAHSANGTRWEVWSWNKAVDGFTVVKGVAEAMRDAIAAELRRFASTATRTCVQCGNEDGLTVDHKSPSFNALMLTFLARTPQLAQYVTNDSTGRGWVIADPQLKEEWCTFHNTNATYQILCRSCNSKKGTRDDSGQRQA